MVVDPISPECSQTPGGDALRLSWSAKRCAACLEVGSPECSVELSADGFDAVAWSEPEWRDVGIVEVLEDICELEDMSVRLLVQWKA